MPSTIETYDITTILQPAQRPEDARQDAVKWGASLTIAAGTAVGIKTSDGLAYALNPAGNDGTQNFVGFAMYSFKTDASSKVFYGSASTSSWRTGPWSTSAIWIKGIFNPQDIQTKAAPATQVLTFTPANPTTGDVYTMTFTTAAGQTTSVSFTVGATQTATAVVTGLKAAWNANTSVLGRDSYKLSDIAVASGAATLILTSVTAGNADAITSTIVGTGTNARVVTTASTGRSISDVLVGCPGARLLHNGFWEIP